MNDHVPACHLGVFGPAGLMRDPITKVNYDVVSILGAADMKQRLASLGAEPLPMSAEQFGGLVRDEIAKWAKVVKDSGAKVD